MSGDNRLQGKVGLVLGGSRGIGAAIVRRLAADGASVAFTYARSHVEAAALAAALEAEGRDAFAITADSAEIEAVRSAVATTVARFGRLDVVVANAGVALTAPFADYALEDFDRTVAVNIRSLLVAAQAALPHLPSGGRIIAIGSSVADRTSFPGASVYAMSKAAVASLVRGMAIDLAPRGITVNTVQPGPTATDLAPEEGARAEFLKNLLPLKRLGRDHEIAGLVAYVASAESAFMTGSTLSINGGLNA
jgi:3-oxoacyl-[acyl-carrier protein] reductase